MKSMLWILSVRAHLDRIGRLMERHEDMMK